MEIFDFKHLFITQFYFDSQIDQKEINENNNKIKTETILQTKTLRYEYHTNLPSFSNRIRLPHFTFLCWIHVGACGTIEIIGKLVHIMQCADNTELVRCMECCYNFVFIVFGP